jgi:hypothetical protein
LLMKIEHLFRYPALAVGLMEIEHLFRYPALAVGLKPSASQGEARLRGLERIICSKTMSVGRGAGLLPPPAHPPTCGRGSARRAISPTLQRRAGRRGWFRCMRMHQGAPRPRGRERPR